MFCQINGGFVWIEVEFNFFIVYTIYSIGKYVYASSHALRGNSVMTRQRCEYNAGAWEPGAVKPFLLTIVESDLGVQ